MDSDSDRNGQSDRSINWHGSGESNGYSNLACNRDCNRQSDSGRNGLSDGEGNGQSDVQDNSDNNRDSHGGGDGGEFRRSGLVRWQLSA